MACGQEITVDSILSNAKSAYIGTAAYVYHTLNADGRPVTARFLNNGSALASVVLEGKAEESDSFVVLRTDTELTTIDNIVGFLQASASPFYTIPAAGWFILGLGGGFYQYRVGFKSADDSIVNAWASLV